MPTRAPGPACSSPPPLLPPGSQAGPSPLPLAPASFLAAPGLAPARGGPGPRATYSWVLLQHPPAGPKSPGKGMLHGSPAPKPHSAVVAAMPRLESGRVWRAGLLRCLAGAQLPGSSVPRQGCSWHIPERVRTSPPAPCQALPRLPRCVLSARGWRPGPAPLQQVPGHPADGCGGFLPWLCAGGGLYLMSPHPAGLLSSWGWRAAAPPAWPCWEAEQRAKPAPAAGWQCVLMAREVPQGSGMASYQRAPATAVPGL